jgi:actin-related protein 8
MFVDPLARSAEDIAIDRDSVLPVTPLDLAILTSVTHAAKGDNKKVRDFLGSIMAVGGGIKTPGLITFLEGKLKARRPDIADKILITVSGKDYDPQVVIWKGGSVFSGLRHNDSWVGQLEYERLGSRCLHHKAIWAF